MTEVDAAAAHPIPVYSVQSRTSSLNARRRNFEFGWGELSGSGFDGSGATPGWWADVLWIVGIGWLIAGGQMPDGSLFFVWRMRACGKNVESLRGRDETLLFSTSFSLSFSTFFRWCHVAVDGGGLSAFGTRASFEEWRAGTVGWSLESAFSAVDMLVSTTQNCSWCKSTRTAGFVFGQE